VCAPPPFVIDARPVKRTFAIGPQITYSYVSTDTYRADWVAGELGFTWYFIPKQ